MKKESKVPQQPAVMVPTGAGHNGKALRPGSKIMHTGHITATEARTAVTDF
ncbi:hypothetical protein ACNKHL_02660 [Shigella flexneri]